MINQYRGIAIATLIFSLLIIIGMGHGAVPSIVVEAMLPLIHKDRISFKLFGSYEESIFLSHILLLVGQFLLFISTHKMNVMMRLMSLIVLWAGFFYQVHNIFSNDNLAVFTFATGLPFLTMSIVLFSFDVRQYVYKPLQEEG